MPASSQKTPNIRSLRLDSDQLKAAKKFANDIGIGTNDDLYYYALLWYKENVRADGDFLSPSKRKRYDKELEKKKNNKSYKGAIGREIIGQIVILSTQKVEDKDLIKDNDSNVKPEIQAATVRIRRRTTPVSPPKPKVEITIDKEEVEKGESYTVSWKSENANYVSRSRGFNPQLKDIDLNGSQTLKADRVGSKTFYITVRNQKGTTAIASATIIIVQVKTDSGGPDDSTQQPPSQPRPRATTTRVTRQSNILTDIQTLKRIHSSLSNIVDILEKQAGIIKAVEKTKRKEGENERRKKRESILETAKGAGGVLVEKALTPIKSIFEKIWRFIFFTLLGRAFTEFLNWFNDPKNTDKVKTLSRFLKDNFWLLIGGAALMFLTPFGGFITSLIGKLVGWAAKLAAKKLLFTPAGLAALIFSSGAIIPKVFPETIEEQERATTKKPGTPQEKIKQLEEQKKNLNIIEIITGVGSEIDEQIHYLKTGKAKKYYNGGQVTEKTGEKIRGAGTDTQLTALTPGEIVMNRSAVQAVGADNLLALNKMFGGANANKPKKLGNIFGMSGGGIVGKTNSSKNTLLNPKAKSIFQRLVNSGLTRTAAAGIVANIGVETAYTYNPNTHQFKNGPGRGLVQWEKGGRFDTDPINLTSFAKSRKKPWNDLNTQIDFIVHELNTHPEYQKVKTKLNAANSVSQATNIFLRDYEKAGVPHLENRLKVANEIVQDGWLNPPKVETNKPKPPSGISFIQSLFSAASRPASASSNKTKPTSGTPRKSINDQKYSQIGSNKPKTKKPWWDLSRFTKKKSGGIIGDGMYINHNMHSINGLTADRFPTLLQDGEYVIPKLTVQRIGLKFFNELVAKTDKNSQAAKIINIQKNESLIQHPPNTENFSQVIKLPPIVKNNTGSMSAASGGTRSQIPPFPTISPQASGTRAFHAEIYKLA